jgi:arylformamidase
MSQTSLDALQSDAIDAEYDPSRRVFSRQPYMDWYVRESVRTRENLGGRLDVPFGLTPAETLDIFPSAKPDSPVLMFIHGGYWRALSSKEFSYVAGGLVPHDITVVVMNYALCPEVSIPAITAQSRAAVAWLTRNAQHYCGNPSHIVVAGHSAGGQQVGMLLSDDRSPGSEPAGAVLKGGIAISGLFDLRPLQQSWLQPTLRLTDQVSAEQSPLLHIPSKAAPLLLSVGGDETDAFKSQSQRYLVAWKYAGLDGGYFAQPGLNHYESVYGFADPTSPLSTAAVDFIKRCAGATPTPEGCNRTVPVHS